MIDIFDPKGMIPPEEHNMAFIEVNVMDHVMTIHLNRPSKKNALHPKMVEEIAYCMQYASTESSIWMIKITAAGDVFCAGADLKAMAGIIEPHDSTVPEAPTEILIGELFNKIHKPVIAQVEGHVFAGGFFFLAGSHIVIAAEHVMLGLPEVKRGLFPFQVMAALLQVMPARKVIDWCIRGYTMGATDALRYGLLTEVCSAEDITSRTNAILEELKQNSPKAIQKGLEAYDTIRATESQHAYLHKMLMETIASKDGQEGLSAFREKRRPRWTGE